MDPRNRLAILASALDSDARNVAQIARTLGFAGLLFDAVTPTLDLADLSQTGRREFRHVLSGSNLQLIGLRAETGPKGFSAPATIERVIQQLERAMETAAGLAAPLLCLDLGPLAPPPMQDQPTPKVSQEMAGLIILPAAPLEAPAAPARREPTPADAALASNVDAALAELCARADRYSVTLAVRSDLSSLASLNETIRRAACPWLGVDFDTVAALRDEWAMDEIFSRLGPLIRHVRLRDASLGADHRTRPATIGAGSIDWPQLLHQFDEVGYHGWMTIDPTELPDRRAAATAALKHLRSIP